MRDLVKAEWLKIWSGRAWWALPLVGLAMCVLADSGFAAQALKQLPAGQTTPEVVTSTLVQGWFMIELFAALLALVAVTKEYASGAISRSVLLSGSRGRLLSAKLLAAAASGVLLAVPTAILAAASPWLFLAGRPYHPVWTADATWTLLGVVLVVVAGAVWGSLLGLLIRHPVGAVVVLLANTWVVSESVFRLAPAVGRFTLDEAMAAVYRSGQAHLLPVPAALLVVAGWLVPAALLARRQFLTRDLP